MIVQIINKSPFPMPEYKTPNSAGMDLQANLETSITINPLERVLIHTGLYIKIPDGCEAQIRPRSGLAIKHGITVINSPGTIDADYIGEVLVGLINLSKDPFTINPGDRIAQIVFARYRYCNWMLVESLEETERGEGGIGHTGI